MTDQVIDDVRSHEIEEHGPNGGRTLAYGALAASALLVAGEMSSAQAQAVPLTDIDILNFLLNLEYLQTQYYAATIGVNLPNADISGGFPNLSAPAQVSIPGARAIAFADPLLGQFAREVAVDDLAHLRYMREQLIIAGGLAVARPTIDFQIAFASAMQAAGVSSTFDPFANDDSFLLAAFFLQDWAVSAYKGLAALIINRTYLEGLMGIMATKAYHAAFVRMHLLQKGVANPSLITAANAISDYRDSLDGAADLDQGIAPVSGASRVAPADANGLAFGRTPAQTLNIAYLQRTAVSSGGFFPSGLNGTVRTSNAN